MQVPAPHSFLESVKQQKELIGAIGSIIATGVGAYKSLVDSLQSRSLDVTRNKVLSQIQCLAATAQIVDTTPGDDDLAGTRVLIRAELSRLSLKLRQITERLKQKELVK